MASLAICQGLPDKEQIALGKKSRNGSVSPRKYLQPSGRRFRINVIKLFLVALEVVPIAQMSQGINRAAAPRETGFKMKENLLRATLKRLRVRGKFVA